MAAGSRSKVAFISLRKAKLTKTKYKKDIMNTLRDNLIWTLKAISDESILNDYQNEIKFDRESTIDELICMWADDLYHPKSEIFKEHFSIQEIEILEDFNRIFEELADDKTQKTWPQIREAARDSIKELGWDLIEGKKY